MTVDFASFSCSIYQCSVLDVLIIGNTFNFDPLFSLSSVRVMFCYCRFIVALSGRSCH